MSGELLDYHYTFTLGKLLHCISHEWNTINLRRCTLGVSQFLVDPLNLKNDIEVFLGSGEVTTKVTHASVYLKPVRAARCNLHAASCKGVHFIVK